MPRKASFAVGLFVSVLLLSSFVMALSCFCVCVVCGVCVFVLFVFCVSVCCFVLLLFVLSSSIYIYICIVLFYIGRGVVSAKCIIFVVK